jgi:hypothetical protein
MDSNTPSKNEDQTKEAPLKVYTARISDHVHDRLERHVQILKKLIDRSATKQRWLFDSIEEKLARDIENPTVPKESTINVKIDKEQDKQIHERIEFMKKFKCSYSKKQWIVEAILEKLERDEKEVDQKIIEQTEKKKQKSEMELLKDELAELKARVFENSR